MNTFTKILIFFTLFLVALFIVAWKIDIHLFFLLAAAAALGILYLIPVRIKILRKQSEASLVMQDFLERINLVDVEIEREIKAISAFKQKIVNYSQLKGVTERLSQCLTMDDVTAVLPEDIARLFGSESTTVIIYLFHLRSGDMGILASLRGKSRINLKSKKGDEFDRWVMKTMQPLLIEDTKSDFRFDIDKITIEDAREIRSLISVPLMVGNKGLGIIRIDSTRQNSFGTEELRFMTTIGDVAAVAIENAQLFGRVEQLAIKDSLTGLYHRRYMLERLSEESIRQLKNKGQLSFMMIDLDNFKQYNDKFGHVAGDIVLKSVGMILSEFFDKPGNLVCRYGGEEFCVLLPDCSKLKAIELAEGVRNKIEQQSIVLRREKTKITVSVGVAAFPKDAQTKEDLIAKADQSMYLAKQQGRNRVVGTI